LRRKRQEVTKVHTFGDFALDTISCELACKGTPVKLTPKEYRLLCYFLDNTGRVLTRDTLLNQVWGYNAFVTQRSVDRCVTTLRNKIEPHPQAPSFIHTVRDFGYKFDLSKVEI
jgi:DNA-binding response OmpR family regulator